MLLLRTQTLAPHANSITSPIPLVARALDALAAANAPADQTHFVEERSVWEPTSWLVQCCWEALAKAGAGHDALAVAGLTLLRQPLATLQALHRLAQQVEDQPALAALVQEELQRTQATFLRPATMDDDANQIERLLLAAASAALVGDAALACTCLEQIERSFTSWSRIVANPEWRALLVETVAQLGLLPQTEHLVVGAVRRFDDPGVQFLHQIVMRLIKADGAHTAIANGAASPEVMGLLAACVDTLRYAPLISVQNRRLAVTVFAQAGLVDELLAQLTTIANLLAAQRDSGLMRQSEAMLLRQVKRPKAKPEIDFQVYTLQEAVAVLPVREIPQEQRLALIEQLAWLGVRSDGWTAAGAASTLLALGAVEQATSVINRIAANDPTRSEGSLAVVRGLLAMGEPQLAAEQVNKALAWARTQEGRNPERAITWGLAEIYLKQGEPEQALHLLERWRTPTGWRYRLRSLLGRRLDDDALRNQSLRLQALLQLSPSNKEVQKLVADLRIWAPRLLDGEALINFYVQGLLQPLLTTGNDKQAWALLPQLLIPLNKLNGHKHAVRITEVTTLLAQQLAPSSPLHDEPPTREILATFLANLWAASAQRGIWQVVHSIEGSLPLLLTLAGPQALVAIARAVVDQGQER